MKIEIKTTTEAEVSHVRIVAPVNYEEEEIPNNFPFRIGDTWAAVIELETGKIEGWPEGRPERMHLTVKDGGTYVLLSPDGHVVASQENDYVPHCVIPGKYGDTIELDIDATGKIINWGTPNLSEFIRDERD